MISKGTEEFIVSLHFVIKKCIHLAKSGRLLVKNWRHVQNIFTKTFLPTGQLFMRLVLKFKLRNKEFFKRITDLGLYIRDQK